MQFRFTIKQHSQLLPTALVNVFSRFGIPDIVHSDQGRNFESMLLKQTLEAFGVSKTRTTAYHPQGDGMVERFNRSLLQLLRTYVEEESDWERFLPLILHAYLIPPREDLPLCSCLEGSQSSRNSELQIRQHMTRPLIRLKSHAKWRNSTILLKPTLFTQLLSKGHSTTSIPGIVTSRLVIMSGCPFLRLENLIQNGKGSGNCQGNQPHQHANLRWKKDPSRSCQSLTASVSTSSRGRGCSE